MPQKCETIRYCSPAPYREPRKQTFNPHQVWRLSTMHLKTSSKPQDEELHQERRQDDTGSHVDQRGACRTEWGVRQASNLMGLPGNGTGSRCPLTVISTNTLRYSTTSSTPTTKSRGSYFRSWSHKNKTPSSVTTFTSSLVLLSTSPGLENEDSLRIYQEEDGEGSLDIWAVIKPGNTKEKIAIFTAQKCSHAGTRGIDGVKERGAITSDMRTISMKSKGCWDGDWSVAKRRKRSGNTDKSSCIESPAQKSEFCTALLNPNKTSNFSPVVAGEIVRTDGEEGGRTLSVVEMVAFLEQRATSPQIDLKRPSLRNSNSVHHFKGVSLLQQTEQLSKDQQLPVVHDEEESVRVLDMVAKLESQCLSRHSAREGGDLSRNNSLRRRVGRVLLAGSEPYSVLLQPAAPSLPQEASIDIDLEKTASDVEKPRAPPKACMPVQSECFVNSRSKHQQSRNLTEQDKCAEIDTVKNLHNLTNQACADARECNTEPPPGMLFFAHSSPQAFEEQANSKNGSISKNPEVSSNGQEDGHAGALSLKKALDTPPPEMSFSEEKVDKLGANHNVEEMEEVSLASRGLEPLRRLASHDFLETRFKIQLLLEPQPYMAFLPHHIIVKIFSLLPTESLAALKCTCHYFKFIIESYGVRPADSRWVSDPRYRDDPCKQCKKRYGHGDVSLCRWHHKPYCQALPYGPGYWMCCRGAHKDTPGCNVGVHDNRWVPAFHSIHMPIYKKSRDSGDDA